MVLTWFNNFLNKTFRKDYRARDRKPRPTVPRFRRRPWAECLENRLAPASISIPRDLLGATGATVLAVPINIDQLSGAETGGGSGVGMSSASIILQYDINVFQPISTATSGANQDVFLGSVETTNGATGWSVSSLVNANASGTIDQLTIGLTTTANITTAGSGSLALVNLHVKPSAPTGPTALNLYNDPSTANPTISHPKIKVFDSNFAPYALDPGPTTAATDAVDGILTVTVGAPVAVDDSYSMAERDAPGDSGLTLTGANGLLSNDGAGIAPLMVVIDSQPANGTISNLSPAAGTLIYATNLDFHGSDSFTYHDVDANGVASNEATVSITLTTLSTAHLSIPTNISTTPGGIARIPVNLSNPNPRGQTGLAGGVLDISYDPSIFTSNGTFLGASPDLKLGSVLSSAGWTTKDLGASQNLVNAHEMDMVIQFSNAPTGDPAITATAGGSLVLMTFHVAFNAPGGPQTIRLPSSSTAGGMAALNDSTTLYTLYPQASDPNSAPVAGVDGTITILTGPPPAFTIVVASSANASVFGQNVTFTGMFSYSPPPGPPTGTMQFIIDGSNYGSPVTIVGGSATLNDAALSVGTHTVTVSYSGDGYFTASSGTLAGGQTVTRASSSTTVSSSVNSSVFGQSVTFTATVTALNPGAGTPSGTVQFVVDGSNYGGAVTLAGGSAAVSDAALGVGTHTVTVSYSGDSNFMSSSGALAGGETVTNWGSAGATTALASSTNPSVFGQAVTFTVTVRANSGTTSPRGTVQFVIDGSLFGSAVALAGGSATISDVALSVGAHTVTVSYSGDSNFTSSSGALTGGQTVTKASASATLSSSANPSVLDQSVTFTATVSAIGPGAGTPAGTVQFVIDGSNYGSPMTLSGGSATISDATLNGGTHTVTIGYSGDINFTPVNGTLTGGQAVNKAASGTSISASANPSMSSQSVVFTASVFPVSAATGYPTGTVQFIIDGQSFGGPAGLVGGHGTINVPTLGAGTHTVAAIYSGDSTFSGSSGFLSGGQTVNQAGSAATSTAVSSSANSSVFGQNLSFTATVKAVSNSAISPTGTVQFIIDGSFFYSPVVLSSSGTAIINAVGLGAGTHVVTAQYSGDGNFTSSNGSLTGSQTVNQASARTVVIPSLSSLVFGQSVTFTVTVSPASSPFGLPTGSVQFVIDGSTFGSPLNLYGGRATISDGALGLGTHTVTVIYSGDANVLSNTGTLNGGEVVYPSSSTVVRSSFNPSLFGPSVTFTVTVTAVSPTTGTPSGTVQFFIDGSNFGSPLILSAGTATLSVAALSIGTHTATASYSGDSNFTISSGSLNGGQTINKAFSSTLVTSSVNAAAFGQGVTFSATVSAVDPVAGAPAGAVQFLLDGSNLGGSVSLAGGLATISASVLSAGTHTVTVRYSGDSNFASSSGMLIGGQTVNMASVSTAVSSSTNPALAGQNVTFTATVRVVGPGAGTPGGSIQFIIDGNNYGGALMLAGGSATVSDAALSVGTHTVTLSYSGDSNFAGSTGTLTGGQTVNPASSLTALTSSANASVLGQGVTFTATVSTIDPVAGAPSGSVQFVIDGSNYGSAVPLAGGSATVSDAGLSAGTHIVTANYSGDSNFAAGSGTLAGGQTVTLISSSTTVGSSANASFFGENVTFTARVGAVSPGTGTPSGTVQFVIDGSNFGGAVALAGGSATISDAALSVGLHTVTAGYNGDNSFAISTGTLNGGQAVLPAGANASVFVPRNLAGGTGTTLMNVPIFINQLSGIEAGGGTGTGMTSAQIVLRYDLNVFQPLSTTPGVDINLGSVETTNGATGWSITSVINSTPKAGIEQTIIGISSSSSITSTFGGSLALLNLHIKATAPTGPTALNLYNDPNTIGPTSSLSRIKVFDSFFNKYGLNPAATTAASDAVDGILTVMSGAPVGGDDSYSLPERDGPGDPGLTLTSANGILTNDGGMPPLTAVLDTQPANGTVTGFSAGSGTFTYTPNIDFHGSDTFSYHDVDANNASGNEAAVTITVTTLSTAHLSIPSTLTAIQGGTISVPVNLSNPNPNGQTGLTGGVIDISYDPTVFTNNGSFTGINPDLQLGAILTNAGWRAQDVYANQHLVNAHEMDLVIQFTNALTGDPAIITTTGGSLVVMAFHVPLNAAVGRQTIRLPAASAAGGNTGLNDSTNLFTLYPQPSAPSAPSVAGVDGVVQVDLRDGPLTVTTVGASANASVFGQQQTLTASVSGLAVVGTPTGEIQFVIDGNRFGSPVTLTNGSATINDQGLNPGAHTVTASYFGDINFAGSYGTLSSGQTVNQAVSSTAVSSSAHVSVFGQNVTLTAAVSAISPGSGTPGGTVQFVIDGSNYGSAVTLAGGSATVTDAALGLGTHTISVSYSGDNNFTASSAGLPGDQTVNQASTTTAVNSSANTSVFGQNVTFTALVNAVSPSGGTPGGTVQFVIDGSNFGGLVTLTAGSATISEADLSVGTHTVTVSYSRDSNFTTSTGTLFGGQTVTQASSSAAVASAANAAVFGQVATFTVTVSVVGPGSGLPGGTVQFVIDGSNLGGPVALAGGNATVSAAALSVGTHTVTASYNGDGNFMGSTGSLSGGQTVKNAVSSTAVSTSVNPAVFGQNVTFTAKVSAVSPGPATPGGTVQFVIDGSNYGDAVALAGGSATVSAAALSAGSHSVTVNYGGDTNFTTSSGTLSGLMVSQASTITAISSSMNPSVFGQSVTFTATVSTDSPGAGAASGRVWFLIDGSISLTGALLGDSATVSEAALSTGTHTVTASYIGDRNFAASSGTVNGGQTVRRASSLATLSSSLNPSVFGNGVIFTTTISAAGPGAGIPMRTVQYTIDGTNLGGAVFLQNGSATIVDAALRAGVHTVTASYSGDGSFLPSSATLIGGETVTQALSSTLVTSSVKPSVFGQSVTFTATVTAANVGRSAFTGSVQFAIDGSNFGAPVTLSNGSATVSGPSLSMGTHTVAASYSGDSNFSMSTGTLSGGQSVSQVPSTTTVISTLQVVLGQDVTFTAVVGHTGAGTPGGTVQFVIDGANYGSAVALSGGSATVDDAALSVGAHAVTASYSGDSNLAPSGSSPRNVIVYATGPQGSSTYVTSSVNASVIGQSVTFTAHVGPGGSASIGSVQFVIDGTNYGSAQPVNAASATISDAALAFGTHTVRAIFSGDIYYMPSSGVLGGGQTVVPASTVTAVSCSLNPSVFGKTVIFTAVVSAASSPFTPTGTVQFIIDGSNYGGAVTLSGGKATVSDAALGVGAHAVVASYSPDPNFLASSGTLGGGETVITDVRYGSTTTLASTANPSVFGQAATFTAVVTGASGTPTPNGTVQFVVDGANYGGAIYLGAGSATVRDSALSIGTHTVAASYSGDSNFVASMGRLSGGQTVNQSGSVTALSSSAAPSLLGQYVTFTARVSAASPGGGTPTGAVQFIIDGSNLGSAVNLSSGGATIRDTALSGGSHTVSASYSGDSHFIGGSGTLAGGQAVLSSSTAVQSSLNPAVVGQNVTFTAGVVGINPGHGTVTEFPVLTANSYPRSITAGPDGNLWFTEESAQKIGFITPSGTVSEYSLPITSSSSPAEITAGPDGNLWFTYNAGQTIGRITPTGAYTEFPVPRSTAWAGAITAGPDGNVWFTVVGGLIGRITPSGTVSMFAEPSASSDTPGITAGPDGNIWFTESTENKIGRITPSGTITEFVLPTAYSRPTAIVSGPDGNLWFTELTNGRVGRITPTGTLTEFAVPTSYPAHITAGSSNSLWFTDNSAGKIGRITTSGLANVFPVPSGGSGALGVTAGPDGNVWFTEANVNKIGRMSPPTISATGTVQFIVDGSKFGDSVALSGGSATISDAGLSAGTHTVTATYSGDGNFTSSSGTLTNGQTVSAAPPGVSVSISQELVATQGQTLVTVPINVNELSGPEVSGPSGTGFSSARIVLRYDTGVFLPISTALSGSQQDVFLGSVETLNGTTGWSIASLVDSNPTGTIHQLIINISSATPITTTTGGNLALINVHVLPTAPAGPTALNLYNDPSAVGPTSTHPVIRIGDSFFNNYALNPAPTAAANDAVDGIMTIYPPSSTNDTNANTGSAPTAIATVSSSATISAYGQNVTFTAIVTPSSGTITPMGYVQFIIDGSNFGYPVILSNGSAAVSDAALSVGAHTVKVTYYGDFGYGGSSGSLASGLTVIQASSSTSVGSSANPSELGQSVIFTATVGPVTAGANTPGGTVQFIIDGSNFGGAVTLAGGSATVSDAALSVGTHTVTVNYSGDRNFFTSSGTLGGRQVVNPRLVVTSLAPTPTGFVANFSKAFDPTKINVYDITLTGQAANPGFEIPGSVVLGNSNQTLTFVATNMELPDDTYRLDLTSSGNGSPGSGAALGFADQSGVPLDGANNAGTADYATTFTTTYNSTALTVSVPGFARGPGQAVNIDLTSFHHAPSKAGIPIQLSGVGIAQAVSFTLSYDANLLTITPVTNGASALGTYSVATAGAGAGATAAFTFTARIPLTLTASSAPVTLGQLSASVPSTAAYKSKQLLHVASPQTLNNNNPVTAVGQDGVQVVAFLGNASGTGRYEPLDTALMAGVEMAQQTGGNLTFAAFPLADPALVAGADGAIDPNSISEVMHALVSNPAPGITDYSGPPSNNPPGPDPALAVGSGQWAVGGGQVSVPVNIDDPHPAGSGGLMEATLALTYDPKVLSISPRDIHLGSVPRAGTGWILAAPLIDRARGQLGITLYSLTPIVATAAGSLVTLDFHVLAGASATLSPIPLVAAVNVLGQEVQTALADSQGFLTLHQLPANGFVPNRDGQVVITTTNIATVTAAAVEGARRVTATPTETAGPVLPSVAVEESDAPEAAHAAAVPVTGAVFLAGAHSGSYFAIGVAAAPRSAALPGTAASPATQRLVEQVLVEQARALATPLGQKGLEALSWDATDLGLDWLADQHLDVFAVQGRGPQQVGCETACPEPSEGAETDYTALDHCFAQGGDELE